MTMTYASLVSQVQAYMDRTDTSTTDQIDNFILNAHKRLFRDLDGHLGLQKTAGTLNFVVGDQTISAPDDWIRTISFSYVNASDELVFLRERSPEYCELYVRNAADPSSYADPKFYSIIFSTDDGAVYPADIFITPPPISTYPYDLIYMYEPVVISSLDPTNWFTTKVPDLLFFATMAEASLYLKKENEMIALWEARYTDGVAKEMAQNKLRKTDRYSTLDAG